jgi:hypothetical protein
MDEIRNVVVERYITPFKEGGSLPALTAADDGFEYVIKFKGAGQGTRALIADFVGNRLAKHLGLNVPEPVFATLGKTFGQSEPDEEIQDLLKKSEGINLGVSFLAKAITFDPVATFVSPDLADKILWIDAFLMNVDRTVKNTNILLWHKEIWLIDFGAALYFHHNIENWHDYVSSPFTKIDQHVLRYNGNNIAATDKWMKEHLSENVINDIINAIPDEWFYDGRTALDAADQRHIYKSFLTQRLASSHVFLPPIQHYESKKSI